MEGNKVGNQLLETIFSVKNDKDNKHKIVKVLGAKIKFKKINLNYKINYFKIMHDKTLEAKIPDDLTLQLYFNSDCNCRCKFCFAERVYSDELKIMQPKMLYEDLVPLYKHTANLVPTNGEITFHKEGYEFLSYINKNYPYINIFAETNGIAFDEKWQKLAAENLMRVNFSLNAINEEYFKKTVWEKDGVYELIKKNLNNYINLLDKKGLGLFRPSVSCVINSTNYETVDEFVKMALEMKIFNIVFFIDAAENNLYDKENPIKDMEGFKSALIKLMEIERIVAGKVMLGYKLFFPTADLYEIEKRIKQEDINIIREKHPEISKLTDDMQDFKSIYLEKEKIRKEKGKKPYSYYEELTGVCNHQFNKNNKIICKNPWNHILLRPNGQSDICPWRTHIMNINNFRTKSNNIDWHKYFNNYTYRLLRKNFQKGCYADCMPNCPAMENVSVEDFRKRYSL